MNNLLKVYPSETYHSPVIMVGDLAALISLRNAIDQAILDGKGKAETMEIDGEGYNVYVIKQDNLDNLPMHYVDNLDYTDTIEKWKNVTNLLRESFPEDEK